MFDPEMFLNVTTNEANATTLEPIPEGEYIATIKEVKPRQSGDYVLLDVVWTIDDAALAEQLGRKSVTVRQSIFLDITETGGLATGKGKNVGLGRLREAVGQNRPGQPWSPGMLAGAGPCRITVKHRTNDDGSQIYEDVRQVAAL